MKEEFVTFEQAKELKELGFPQWSVEDNSKEAYDCIGEIWSMRYFDQNPQDYYSVASLSLVQKWLREEKKIYIQIGYVTDWKYQSYIVRYLEDGMPNIQSRAMISDTYEGALSEGIDECIDILKNNNYEDSKR